MSTYVENSCRFFRCIKRKLCGLRQFNIFRETAADFHFPGQLNCLFSSPGGVNRQEISSGKNHRFRNFIVNVHAVFTKHLLHLVPRPAAVGGVINVRSSLNNPSLGENTGEFFELALKKLILGLQRTPGRSKLAGCIAEKQSLALFFQLFHRIKLFLVDVEKVGENID